MCFDSVFFFVWFFDITFFRLGIPNSFNIAQVQIACALFLYSFCAKFCAQIEWHFLTFFFLNIHFNWFFANSVDFDLIIDQFCSLKWMHNLYQILWVRNFKDQRFNLSKNQKRKIEWLFELIRVLSAALSNCCEWNDFRMKRLD